MKGVVGVENLKVTCFVGVYPEEKLAKQELLIDLKLRTDFSKSTQSDSLQDAIDYDKIAELCQETAALKHYHLIETLANAFAEGILQHFSVDEVWVRVKKLQGLAQAQYAYVELTKRRTEWLGH
ncbi:MAG: dihydroneopterin aldolase [Parachlamydiaceae bacterium]